MPLVSWRLRGHSHVLVVCCSGLGSLKHPCSCPDPGAVLTLSYVVSLASSFALACLHGEAGSRNPRERDGKRKWARPSEAEARNWNRRICLTLLAKTSRGASPDSPAQK